ncbi:MAG: tyrosine--tRNA ligase, partial [Candidatus Puniceispirillum sp.]
AKIVLADEATRLCHSAAAADHAKATAATTFGEKGMGDGLPQFAVTAATLERMDIIGALTTVGFAQSNGEARRLVRGGGARVNDHQVTDEATPITAADFTDGRAKISAGKKRHALLVLG